MVGLDEDGGNCRVISKSITTALPAARSQPLEALAYCLFTSGTTGKPKLVRVPHECVLPNVRQLVHAFEYSPGDRVFMASPITFDPSVIGRVVY